MWHQSESRCCRCPEETLSGHSKWHNIQKTKGAADAKRSATFTKIAKEIIVAVKQGGSGDPANNSRLATVVAKALPDLRTT